MSFFKIKKLIMKYIYIAIIYLLTYSAYSQQFDYELIDELSTIKKEVVDDYLINGYGFVKWDEKSKDKSRYYIRVSENNRDSAIIINIALGANGVNFVKINLAKNYSIRDFKVKILEMGYKYLHTDEDKLSKGLSEEQRILFTEFLRYSKDNRLILIGKKPNDVGATEILIMN